jgi:site-specific DNA-methyltransferase (adenine-specific)
MKIAIKDIKINERIRKEYGDIEDLASSMSRLGQLQPIVLGTDNLLLAGGRRLAAAVHLGWPEIDATRLEGVDDIGSKEIELEENLKRKDLAWPEEVRALRALYDLKVAKYGAAVRGRPARAIADLDLDTTEGYSLTDAASELERSLGSISMDIQLARGLDEFPQLEEEKNKSSAFKRFKRLKETQLRTEQARRTRLDDVTQTESEDNPSDSSDTVADSEDSGDAPRIRTASIKKIGWKGKGLLYLADCRDVLRALPEGSADCIITDPPFGLGLFKEGSTTSGQRLAEHAGAMYDDDPHKIMDMLDEVFMLASKVLKPDGHAYIFFHMTRYEEVFTMLRKHFGTCEESPIIWSKNTPGIGDPNTSWVYSYEPCFWVNRGRHLVKPQAFNVLKYDTIPPGQKIHPTQKPAALLRHLVQASCVQNEVVLDPFAGSGSTLVGALQVGCKFIGCEKSEAFHRSAVEWISEEIGAQDAIHNEVREAEAN